MKPKLTLRDLFWLVLVCALGCAWWLDQQALLGQIEERHQPFGKQKLLHIAPIETGRSASLCD